MTTSQELDNKLILTLPAKVNEVAVVVTSNKNIQQLTYVILTDGERFTDIIAIRWILQVIKQQHTFKTDQSLPTILGLKVDKQWWA